MENLTGGILGGLAAPQTSVLSQAALPPDPAPLISLDTTHKWIPNAPLMTCKCSLKASQINPNRFPKNHYMILNHSLNDP